MTDNDDLFTYSRPDPKQWEYDELPEVTDGKPKLDIWDELANADRGNKDFWKNLSPDLQKQFSPLVAMRWFSIAQDNSQYKEYLLRMTNEMLNVDFWSIREHPELQWKIMSLCGVGKVVRRQWINMPKRRKISKVDEFMLQWFPSANELELKILTKNLSREEFEQFVKSTGCSDQELKEVINNFDAERGTKPVKESKAGGKKRKA
jgi:hypothetical protein